MYFCRIGFHDYGPWELVEQGEIFRILRGFAEPQKIGSYLIQKRICLNPKCQKQALNHVEVTR